MCYTFSAHLVLLDLITLILCSLLQPPVTSSLFGPNVLHITVFSNFLTLYSLGVKDQVSHSYKITGRIKVLYIAILKFFTKYSAMKTYLLNYVPLPEGAWGCGGIATCIIILSTGWM
jgi:hypothetical protein